MSGLVEKVHDAVSAVGCIHTGDPVNGKCADCARITRAAIKAVAEWIGPGYCVTQGNLLNQLKEGSE